MRLAPVVCSAFALCMPAVLLSATEKPVTFSNAAVRPVFVTVWRGQGTCGSKPVKNTFEIAPTEVLQVDPLGQSACYVYSYLPIPEQAPFAAAEIVPGQRIELTGQPKITATITDLREDTGVLDMFSETIRLEPKDILGPVGTNIDPSVRPAEIILGEMNDSLNRESKTDCAKEASGNYPWGGEWRTCIGHRTQWRCIHHQIVVVVDGYPQKEIASDLQACIMTAGVMGLSSAVITGGGGAAEIYLAALTGCLAGHGKTKANPRIEKRTNWTDWGGC